MTRMTLRFLATALLLVSCTGAAFADGVSRVAYSRCPVLLSYHAAWSTPWLSRAVS